MTSTTRTPRRRTAYAVGLAITATLAPWTASSATADFTTASISATFTPGTRVLAVRADDLDNGITVGRTSTGSIRINGGAVPISGGTPTFSTTDLIRVSGFGGKDTLRIDRGGGVMPPSVLIGGAGDDTLSGGSGDDQFSAGPGNDTVDGGPGADAAALGGGNDKFVWVPGDGNDLIEGQAGDDDLAITGSSADETVEFTANGTRRGSPATSPPSSWTSPVSRRWTSPPGTDPTTSRSVT